MKKSRRSRKSVIALAAGICCAPSMALAVQTWTDATDDYAGGSATAPAPGDSYEDIASVSITNNATTMFFQINLAASDGGHATNITTDTTQSYGKYQIGMETVPGAGLVSTPSTVSNPYNPIGISTGMNYWIDNWTNQTTGGTVATPDTGDASVWNYTGGAWNQVAGNGLAGDVAGNLAFTQTTLGTTSITTTVSLAALGLNVGNQFNFDVCTTYDGGAGAVDALDSGPAATSESSSTYVNPYSSPPTPYDSVTAPGSTYSTTIYNVVTPTFTWNDGTAAAGFFDGTTWDVNDNTKYNWNNGIFADYYTDNINVVFNDNNNGNYAVSLNTIVNPASVLVNNSAGNYTISGTGTIGGTGSLTKSGTSTLTLSTANTYSGGTNVTAGLLLIQRTSSTTSALPKGALSISGGEVQLASNVTQGSQSANVPSTAPLSNVNITSLSISGTGVLDISNNHLIVDYTSGHDPIGSIATWIADGAYGSGTAVTWTGTGIRSSAAAANSSYGIGYADAADAGNPAGLAAGQIEIMYTLLGDANLDGKVNGSDFNLMATNFNQAVTGGWDKGDFNYDGKVNGNDFVLLAANFNQFASQSAVSSADDEALDAFAAANGISLNSVPEPASVSLLLAGAAGLMARRRRSAN